MNDDNDPRSKGANENCIGFVNNDLYTVFEVKGEVDIGGNYSLSLCENIGNYKSSFIFKNDKNIIRLAGDINGEKDNKNKFVINDTLITIYLAAGDICSGTERYKVELTIKAEPEKTYDDDDDDYDYYDNHHNYIIRNGCHYQIVINGKVATIYKGYFGFDLSLASTQILFGSITIIFGLVLKILNCISNNSACYITFFVGCFFPLNIIFDLYRYDIILMIVGFIGSVIIDGGFVSVFQGNEVERNSKKYNIILGALCGYPIIKMISIFTIAFIKTTYQKLIHNIFLLIFIICGGILGGKYPENVCEIGSNIFDNYLIIKGLSFFFYSLATPIDEQKIYVLAKTQNFEKINEMICSLGLIYPLIFWGLLIIIPLFKYICYLCIKHMKDNAKNKKKNKETELPTETPNEKEEKCIETPYYETKN